MRYLIGAITGLASITAPSDLEDRSPIGEVDTAAREMGGKYFYDCLRALDDEMLQGPSQPELPEPTKDLDAESVSKLLGVSEESVEQYKKVAPQAASLTFGFQRLVRAWIEALEESTGPLPEGTRQAFNHFFQGAVASNVGLVRDLSTKLR